MKILCDCECESKKIEFDSFCLDNGGGEFLEVTLFTYYPLGFNTFWEKLKLIWQIMRNKKQPYGSMLMKSKDVVKLRDFLNTICEKNGIDHLTNENDTL